MIKAKTFYATLVVSLVAIGSIMTASAFVLPDGFDQPCMGGSGIIADICNTINALHDEQHIQISRIDSINATQVSEQIEQNTIQTDLDIAEATLAGLPSMNYKTRSDTNDPNCELIPIPAILNDWCPNNFSVHFNVTDSEVLPTSMVMVSLNDSIIASCNAINTDDGWFEIRCNTGPKNNTVLYYIIVG